MKKELFWIGGITVGILAFIFLTKGTAIVQQSADLASKVDPAALAKGTAIEMFTYTDANKARNIATQNLILNPLYYEQLHIALPGLTINI